MNELHTLTHKLHAIFLFGCGSFCCWVFTFYVTCDGWNEFCTGSDRWKKNTSLVRRGEEMYAPSYYEMDPSCALRRGARFYVCMCICLCAVHFHINISDTIETPIFLFLQLPPYALSTLECAYESSVSKHLPWNDWRRIRYRYEWKIRSAILTYPMNADRKSNVVHRKKCEQMRRTVKMCATFDSCAHKNFIGDECDESGKPSTIRPTTELSAPFVQAMEPNRWNAKRVATHFHFAVAPFAL